MRDASAISKEAGRDEGLKIARESLMDVRDIIQGVQVSAPFGNVVRAECSGCRGVWCRLRQSTIGWLIKRAEQAFRVQSLDWVFSLAAS